MEKLLIITYYWPPSGGPGVQRWLKLSKYLQKQSVQCYIVTVDEQQANYPISDTMMEKEVHSDLKIFKTNTREPYALYKKLLKKKEAPYSGFVNEQKPGPLDFLSRFVRGNFFVPDARKGWNGYALKQASEIIENEDIKYIITTSPPHSTQLIGIELKKRYPEITWLADLRDPWTDIFYYKKMLHLPHIKKKDAQLEKAVLNQADIITTVSNNLKSRFEAKLHPVGTSEKIYVLPNGYDPEDFNSEAKESTPKEFSALGYTGTLAEEYDIGGLLKVLEDNKTSSLGLLRWHFAGKLHQSWGNQIKRVMGKRFLLHSYVNHQKAIEIMLQSDVLLLVIPRIRDNAGILTGKLFEYLACQKPILGIGPKRGDAAQILEKSGCGCMFDYDDMEGMEKFFTIWIKETFKPNKTYIETFSRASQSKALTHIITQK